MEGWVYNPLTDEHVVGRRFVLKGMLDRVVDQSRS